MPIYDARHKKLDGIPGGEPPVPGSEPFPWPCRTFDANGKQLIMLLSADTETGEVERYDYSLADNLFRIDPVTKRVKVLKERHPAPLRVMKMAPNEPYIAPAGSGG